MVYESGSQSLCKEVKIEPVIKIRNLSKRYGNHQVLEHLNLQVHQGEIFGILGMNGAGKTTLMECMEGLRDYDSGTIEMRGTIGIQLQSASLPAYIKGKEAAALIGGWKKMKKRDGILKEMGMRELEDKIYQEMSTGQRRKLHLALALIGNPDLIFLDEPAAGLDVEGQIRLHKYIRRLKQKGKTIILASHDMREVERLCDRIMILYQGKLIFCGTVEELSVRMGDCCQIQIITAEGMKEFEANDIGEFLLNILQDYKKNKIQIQDIKISRGSLEQHFMGLIKGGKK